MRIDPESPYIRHLILLDNMDEESRKRLQEDAERVYGSPWGLALKDFFALSEGDLSYINLTKETSIKGSVRQYVWMMEFREVVEQVTAILKNLQIPQSPDAQRASTKCLKMSTKESIFVFVRRYFGLRNFNEASEIPLSDFIVAKKDEFNTSIFRHTMNEIQKQKLKKR